MKKVFLIFSLIFVYWAMSIALKLTMEDFAGGSLKCIGEFIYICAPDSGKVYLSVLI